MWCQSTRQKNHLKIFETLRIETRGHLVRSKTAIKCAAMRPPNGIEYIDQKNSPLQVIALLDNKLESKSVLGVN